MHRHYKVLKSEVTSGRNSSSVSKSLFLCVRMINQLNSLNSEGNITTILPLVAYRTLAVELLL